MAQQIHPTAFRLAIEKTWYSQIETKDKGVMLQHDHFIRKLVSGYFLAQNWLSSEVIISHSGRKSVGQRPAGQVRIKLLVYPIGEKIKSGKMQVAAAQAKSLVYLVKYLGYVLEKRNPGINYEIEVRETQSYCDNAKILADWIDIQVSREPRQYRRILQQVIREMKRIQDAKMK